MVEDNKKGFKALLVTQFLGAFNDNAFKFVIAALVVDLIDQSSGGTLYLALSGAVFILPFMLFATFAGFLADRFSKQKVIIFAKILEIVVMGFGFFALLSGNIIPMLVVLFFMGLQSTILSPSKYGILPEILKEEDLSEGNGVLQMWTYIAILLGQTSYGFIMYFTEPHYYQAAYVFLIISALGIFSSFFITQVKPSGSTRPYQFNFLKEIVDNIIWIKKDRAIFLSIIGLMYFGFLGGIFQPNVLLYSRKILQATHLQTGFLISAMTIGLGLGCLLAGRLSSKKVELGLVPLGAIGLSLFSILMGLASSSYVLAVIVIFMLGISCGFYIVPLNTLIQKGSPKDQLGQVLATNTFLSFSAVLLGSLFLYVLRDVIHLNAAQIFIFTGLLTVGGTIYITSLLPYTLVRFIIFIFTHTIYKLKVFDHENLPEKGGALLIPNHMAYLDAVILVVTSSRPIRFLVNSHLFNVWWLKPFLKLSGAIPIASTNNPKQIIRSLREASEALKNGELVCIFPEGHLSRTGNMMKFNQGFERIMKNVDCPIVPVHLDRIWGSIFSFERGKFFFKMPKMIPYPITVSFGKPMGSKSTAFEVRNRVSELGADSFKYRLSDKLTLPEAFWSEARRHPSKFCVADSGGSTFSFGAALISSVALSDVLRKKLGDEKNIGILIPSSCGGLLTNVAVSILNKVPINMNYTTSEESLASIVQQSGMKTVVTSRKFIEKIGVKIPGDVLFIEELSAEITFSEKIKAAVKAFMFPKFLSHNFIFGFKNGRDMDQLATVMFTSGSTGEPKGVMLTHNNITSNLEGLYQVFHVKENDVVMGVLPLFHSFGFTATMWFPLISGIGVVYHNNPLDSKMIGKLVEKFKATILMSTPTFLSTYTKRCTKEQFQSLRIVVVGAEKLKEQVANEFKSKFGIDAMEGYGCTELSPIVSLNLPDHVENGHTFKANKFGKIGLPLPGIAVKILIPDTLQPAGAEENGLLFIKGPNVMKGYLNKAELTNEIIKDGWYATGDIANLDEDGFLMITDRLSRFSKIAGEMVPHIKVEEKIHSLLNASEQLCVVTSIPDEKKGERLAVLYMPGVDVDNLVAQLKSSDLPNLWVPSRSNFIPIDSLPLLGTGKLDLSKIKKIANEKLAESVNED